MSDEKSTTPIPADPHAERMEDYLARVSYPVLLQTAISQSKTICEVACLCFDRAEGQIAAADFDKLIAELVEGEGYCFSESMLRSFRKEDAK